MIDHAIQEKTDTVNILGKDIHTLSATYNALYIFVHLFFHMTASGVGLRQLCDWAMIIAQSAFQDSSSKFQVKNVNDNVNANLNPNKKSSLNREDLGGSLVKLGYFKAYKAMGAFLVEYLGLPEEQFPFALDEKDRKWVETIKKNILKRGNFGRSGRKVKNIGVLHSIETGYLNMVQTLTFYRLAPKEVLLRFTSLGEWFLERFKIKRRRPTPTLPV